MSYQDIKSAEKAFRTAICVHAAQFDMDTIQRAESLLLQARALAWSDPVRSKLLAREAEQIALAAIEKTQNEKLRLKGELATDVGSLIQEYAQIKTALGEIQKKITKPTYLIISQRMVLADLCMKQAEEGLEQEHFSAFPELYARSKQRLLDVAQIITPVLKELNYSGYTISTVQKVAKSKERTVNSKQLIVNREE